MLKRTMAVTRAAVLLGIPLALRPVGFVQPVNAGDFCENPGICHESCILSNPPWPGCFDACDCWFECQCMNGNSESYCFSYCS